MTLQQLKYFRVMANVLHYTQAAKMLFISQSSLSYSLSELEKELGVSLFEKQGKKNILTKYGESFLPFVTNALDKLDEGTRQIEKMLTPQSAIGLGYVYSLSFDFLPKLLTGFCSRPGNSDFSFNFFQGLSAAILDKLKKGELDIALSVDSGDETVYSFPIFKQDLFLVVPRGHPLTTVEKVMVEHLATENFISISPNSSLRRQLDEIFTTIHATPKITFEAEECNAMASFVSAGFGIAIMPEIPALQAYDVQVLHVDDDRLKRDIHMLCMKNRPLSPTASRFRDYLVEHAQLREF